jgi:hypothetical protein
MDWQGKATANPPAAKQDHEGLRAVAATPGIWRVGLGEPKRSVIVVDQAGKVIEDFEIEHSCFANLRSILYSVYFAMLILAAYAMAYHALISPAHRSVSIGLW